MAADGFFGDGDGASAEGGGCAVVAMDAPSGDAGQARQLERFIVEYWSPAFAEAAESLRLTETLEVKAMQARLSLCSSVRSDERNDIASYEFVHWIWTRASQTAKVLGEDRLGELLARPIVVLDGRVILVDIPEQRVTVFQTLPGASCRHRCFNGEEEEACGAAAPRCGFQTGVSVPCLWRQRRRRLNRPLACYMQ